LGGEAAIDTASAGDMTNQLQREAAEDLAAAGSALSVDTTTQVRSRPPGDVICELIDDQGKPSCRSWSTSLT